MALVKSRRRIGFPTLSGLQLRHPPRPAVPHMGRTRESRLPQRWASLTRETTHEWRQELCPRHAARWRRRREATACQHLHEPFPETLAAHRTRQRAAQRVDRGGRHDSERTDKKDGSLAFIEAKRPRIALIAEQDPCPRAKVPRLPRGRGNGPSMTGAACPSKWLSRQSIAG
jgi:hypothetical protein